MSSRAERLPAGAEVQAFDWHGTWFIAEAPLSIDVPESAPSAPVPSVNVAEIEHHAFTRGYTQGERAAADAAVARGEQILRRLSSAVDELNALKADVLQRAERDIVQLSLAIARRIVHREISLDPELVATMARVALDRLGQPAGARIHLHPDDCATVTKGRGLAAGGAVQIVADVNVGRGGCRVHSDLGQIDLSLDAQIAEVEAALLGSPATADAPSPEAVCAA
jgi:flagellar assembly protein FliH